MQQSSFSFTELVSGMRVTMGDLLLQDAMWNQLQTRMDSGDIQIVPGPTSTTLSDQEVLWNQLRTRLISVATSTGLSGQEVMWKELQMRSDIGDIHMVSDAASMLWIELDSGDEQPVSWRRLTSTPHLSPTGYDADLEGSSSSSSSKWSVNMEEVPTLWERCREVAVLTPRQTTRTRPLAHRVMGGLSSEEDAFFGGGWSFLDSSTFSTGEASLNSTTMDEEDWTTTDPNTLSVDEEDWTTTDPSTLSVDEDNAEGSWPFLDDDHRTTMCCYQCGATDHLLCDCPLATGFRPMCCYLCNSFQHLVGTCPHRFHGEAVWIGRSNDES